MNEIKKVELKNLNEENWDYLYNELGKPENVKYINDGCFGTNEEPLMLSFFPRNREVILEKIVEGYNIVALPYETDTIFLFKEVPYILPYKGQNNYGSSSIIKAQKFEYVVVLAEND